MKKLSILAVVLVAASFASCKKDYTCTCSSTGGSNVTKILGVSKKAAQANCVSTSQTVNGTVYDETCTLSK
jgi:phage-related tail protein